MTIYFHGFYVHLFPKQGKWCQLSMFFSVKVRVEITVFFVWKRPGVSFLFGVYGMGLFANGFESLFSCRKQIEVEALIVIREQIAPAFKKLSTFVEEV